MPKVNALPVVTTIGGSAYVIVDDGTTTSRMTIDNFLSATSTTPATYASGIAAAGTNQATATLLTVTKNRVDTVGANTGVVENATTLAGYTRTVQNNGANDLNWYPFGTNQFYIIGSGLQGAGTPIVIAPGNQATYLAYTNGVLTLI